MPTPLDGEPKRPVQRRQVVLAKTPRLAFAKTHPGHTNTALDFIVQGNRVTPKMQPAGKRLQPFSRFMVDELARVEAQ
jgi:hypothetical protein